MGHIPGWCPKDQAERLYYLALNAPEGTDIVEVGSFMGLSLSYLAFGALDGKQKALVHSVDLDDPAYTRKKIGISEAGRRDHMEMLNLRNIQFHSGLSVDVAAHYNGRPVSLLYIDASHEYKDVVADWFAWKPHLVSSARVIFDDYNNDHVGVVKAVNELMTMGEISIMEKLSQGVQAVCQE